MAAWHAGINTCIYFHSRVASRIGFQALPVATPTLSTSHLHHPPRRHSYFHNNPPTQLQGYLTYKKTHPPRTLP